MDRSPLSLFETDIGIRNIAVPGLKLEIELVSVQNAWSCSTAITSQQYYTLQQQAEQSSSIINTYQLIISNWMSKLRIMRETTGGVHIRENLPHESSYTYVVRRIVMRWSQPASCGSLLCGRKHYSGSSVRPCLLASFHFEDWHLTELVDFINRSTS